MEDDLEVFPLEGPCVPVAPDPIKKHRTWIALGNAVVIAAAMACAGALAATVFELRTVEHRLDRQNCILVANGDALVNQAATATRYHEEVAFCIARTR